jgi:hypothetical protein
MKDWELKKEGKDVLNYNKNRALSGLYLKVFFCLKVIYHQAFNQFSALFFDNFSRLT